MYVSLKISNKTRISLRGIVYPLSRMISKLVVTICEIDHDNLVIQARYAKLHA